MEMEIDVASVDPLTLANSYWRFYCEARPQPKKSKERESQNEKPLYHKNSLINIRAAINAIAISQILRGRLILCTIWNLRHQMVFWSGYSKKEQGKGY